MVSRRKLMAGITAVSLTLLLATGTFAWTSLNSQKLNEWHGFGADNTGPGGTLHDDHQENEENKQVYVENWGDEVLYVRIRLSEYMEWGSGAGLKSTGIDPSTGDFIRNPLNLSEPLYYYSVLSGTDIDHVDSWIIHNPYADFTAEYKGPSIPSYWNWEMGGQKYYYPAPVDSRGDKAYIDQNSPDGLTEDSEKDGVKAKQTRPSTIISMDQWKNEGSKIGNYWVIDTDGWAYWAMPLVPGDATGLLLNKVKSIKAPEKDYYYGINVVAQMATKDGTDANGNLDNYETFGLDINSGWTDDGQELMELLASLTVRP